MKLATRVVALLIIGVVVSLFQLFGLPAIATFSTAGALIGMWITGFVEGLAEGDDAE